MELLLKRFAYKDKYTIGRLYFGDLEFCHTLEPGVACGASKGFIPTGYYRVEINYSPKFKTNLPILLLFFWMVKIVLDVDLSGVKIKGMLPEHED